MIMLIVRPPWACCVLLCPRRYLGDKIRTSCRITVGGIREHVFHVLSVSQEAVTGVR
jgi:hypothetical protein